MKTRLLVPIALVFVLFYTQSCKHKERRKEERPLPPPLEEVRERLKEIFTYTDSVNTLLATDLDWQINKAYSNNGMEPFWVQLNYKPTANSKSVEDELAALHREGIYELDSAVGHLMHLRSALDSPKPKIEDAVAYEVWMTQCVFKAGKLLMQGTASPNKLDPTWHYVNDSNWHLPQLLANVDSGIFTLDSCRSHWPLYPALVQQLDFYKQLATDSTYLALFPVIDSTDTLADNTLDADSYYSLLQRELQLPTDDSDITDNTVLLAHYQKQQGLRATNQLDSATKARLIMPISLKIGTIEANLERLRWMKQQPGDRCILVQVPLMEFKLFERDSLAMHMNVVVGKRDRQTPSLYAMMTNVVLNPQWGVPPTILKKDVLPGIQKTGNKYLARKGLKAFDRKGNVVNADQINSKNYRRYQYRQAPGESNALGNVKFNLPNPWDIYLHDTPHRDDFTKPNRALSSGCIRLQHPLQLASYILNTVEQKKYSDERLQKIVKTHKTQWLVLHNKIPVHIVYITSAIDDEQGLARFLPDIYNRDSSLIAHLANRH